MEDSAHVNEIVREWLTSANSQSLHTDIEFIQEKMVMLTTRFRNLSTRFPVQHCKTGNVGEFQDLAPLLNRPKENDCNYDFSQIDLRTMIRFLVTAAIMTWIFEPGVHDLFQGIDTSERGEHFLIGERVRNNVLGTWSTRSRTTRLTTAVGPLARRLSIVIKRHWMEQDVFKSTRDQKAQRVAEKIQIAVLELITRQDGAEEISHIWFGLRDELLQICRLALEIICLLTLGNGDKFEVLWYPPGSRFDRSRMIIENTQSKVDCEDSIYISVQPAIMRCSKLVDNFLVSTSDVVMKAVIILARDENSSLDPRNAELPNETRQCVDTSICAFPQQLDVPRTPRKSQRIAQNREKKEQQNFHGRERSSKRPASMKRRRDFISKRNVVRNPKLLRY